MDIHEIQIDDYVMFDGSVCQIEEISKKGWVHLTLNGNRVHITSDYILDFIEGVPLTPEILLKNGFFLDTYDGCNSKYWIREDFGFGQKGELAIGIAKCWQNTDIQFVHQLQHALRLCGITREIFL